LNKIYTVRNGHLLLCAQHLPDNQEAERVALEAAEEMV
jgi:hypothetical protein